MLKNTCKRAQDARQSHKAPLTAPRGLLLEMDFGQVYHGNGGSYYTSTPCGWAAPILRYAQDAEVA
ncbi:hypothetical protein [Nodularia sp. UHCC 0506]|uniref:hypothetical protein n=1 Tax=Nodularia sp. UHCC 0506 TaxID=3110243 RepID=UPI002B209B40|nr:hypothetical protein [Nodularia sp. UHCC 0506]MEA5515745.1 hypothetical protein [Nodularia sp. UHCC 0506]